MCDFQGDLEQAVSKIDCDEPDLFAKRISNAMSSVFDSHAPIQIKKLSSKTMVSWFNNSIKRAITKRRRFERLWRKDKIEIKRQMLRTARNEVSPLCGTEQSQYHGPRLPVISVPGISVHGNLDPQNIREVL